MKKLLIGLVLLVAMSLPAMAGVPWELPKWARLTVEPTWVSELKGGDWFDMSPEARFWFIRGYGTASAYWATMLRELPDPQYLPAWMMIFGSREQDIHLAMDLFLRQPENRDNPLYLSFGSVWIANYAKKLDNPFFK